MELRLDRRQPGKVPVGAVLMAPLFVLPLGGWLVTQGFIKFGECGMKTIAGIPCLTCGSTRSTLHLMNGDLVTALSYQPMMIGIYAGLLTWGMVSLTTFAFDRQVKIRLSTVEDWLFKGSLIAVPLVNWAYLIWAGV